MDWEYLNKWFFSNEKHFFLVVVSVSIKYSDQPW